MSNQSFIIFAEIMSSISIDDDSEISSICSEFMSSDPEDEEDIEDIMNHMEDYSDDSLSESESSNDENDAKNLWIDADSITDSLQNLNDPGSILNHFQSLYQVESAKSRQRQKEKVRMSNK